MRPSDTELQATAEDFRLEAGFSMESHDATFGERTLVDQSFSITPMR
jgi:hypothetical protein